jgi:aspartyl-tRNA(Asn)/glutamyl-tRNA(Gln) amidotransferase subunit B
MQQGHMRFEPNINLHIYADGKTFKTPISELKNLNSFRAVERSCTYEITRQLAEWHSKGGANQEVSKRVPKFTLGWNDDKGVTTIQRSKEEAEDYRYFPDPDLVPLNVSREWVEQIRKDVVELPIPRRKRYEKDYGLSAKESMMLVDERPVAELFEATIAKGATPRRVVNIMLQKAGAIANERGVLISELPVTADQYAALAKLVEAGTISATAAATVFDDLLKNQGADPKATAEKLGVIQVRDVGATEKWVDEAIAANPNAVDTYKNNPKKKDASLGFLRGAVMKASQGKADPKLVGELLLKKLGA